MSETPGTPGTSDESHRPDRAVAEAAQQGRVDRTLFGDDHIRVYEETDGEIGHIWNGAPCLVLTTTGATTGTPRKHALIYGLDGPDVLVVASKGGSSEHPQWYQNLDTNPQVTVQIRGDRFDGVARTASPDEKSRLWPIMTELWPAYDDYQHRSERDIPLVVISRR